MQSAIASHGHAAARLGAPQPRQRRGRAAQCASETPSVSTSAPSSPVVTGQKRVVLLGGSGRVGSSTASALLATVPGIDLVVGSRTHESFDAAVTRRPELAQAAHRRVDVDDAASLAAALEGADLVVHTAGPFQRRERCGVLEAAIAASVPYLDVCDDTAYSQRAKQLHGMARDAGVPAVTTGGIYPGAGQGLGRGAAGRPAYQRSAARLLLTNAGTPPHPHTQTHTNPTPSHPTPPLPQASAT